MTISVEVVVGATKKPLTVEELEALSDSMIAAGRTKYYRRHGTDTSLPPAAPALHSRYVEASDSRENAKILG